MKIETRLTKNGKPIETELVLKWDGVSDAEVREQAARSVVISWQRIARDSGKIPSGRHTVNVRDILDGKRPPKVISVERLAADAGKLKPAEIAELVKALNKARKGAKATETEVEAEVPAEVPAEVQQAA